MIPPWLRTEIGALSAAYAAGRMPHALLIHEAPGAGGDWLAKWCAQLVLCQSPGTTAGAPQRPCGSCASCRWSAAGQHPDLLLLQPVEESRQIRIEQVRELGEELVLTAHQGSYKVGVISPADALNRFAANALLKTLEEPSQKTLLILVATQPSRLPATILSRCQRVRIAAPKREEALAWLQATRGPGEWAAVLDVVGEAPMLAADADPGVVTQTAAEVRRGLEEAIAGTLDPLATAERWARSELPLRLRCFENWLTERIHAQIGARAFLTEMREGPYLPAGAGVLNIRELFELLDSVRELKSAIETPINRGLALESLLRRFGSRREPRAALPGWR